MKIGANINKLVTIIVVYTILFSMLTIIDQTAADPVTPQISFSQDEIRRSLTVDSVTPIGELWENLEIQHDGTHFITGSDGDIDPGDKIYFYGNTTSVVISHIPTSTILATFTFSTYYPEIVYVDDNYNSGTSGWYVDHFDNITIAALAVSSGGTIYVNSGTYEAFQVIDKPVSIIGQDKYTTIIDANGGQWAAALWSAGGSNVSGFTIKNSEKGIWILLSWDVSIFDNIITDNVYGIRKNSPACSRHNYFKNYIINNVYGIYSDEGTYNDLIYHNNFLQNTYHAYSDGNTWDNGYPSGGNYWYNYTGIDQNNDGFGDTPYNIPGGNGKDNYPLMNPYVPSGHYDISSTPSGAFVYIDDEYQGQTPLFMPIFPAGDHTLKLIKSGYQDRIQTTHLSEGQTLTLDITLTTEEDLTGEGWIFGQVLDNFSLPLEDVTICVFSDINTTFECTYTNAEGLYDINVSIGTYSVKASKTGYSSNIINDVVVEENKAVGVNFYLQEIESDQTVEMGSYDISSNPSGANIYIDDVYQGQTPKIITGVSIGSHIIRLTKSGYQDWSGTSYLQRNQTITYDVTLTPEEEHTTKGLISGNVTNASGYLLEDASVCVQIPSTDDTRCVYTNENGEYVIEIQTGIYSVKACEEEYSCSIVYDVIVYENQVTTVNFILEDSEGTENESRPPLDANEQLIEEKIRYETLQGGIGARIYANTGGESIEYYSDKLAIDLNSAEENVSFTVSAEDGTSGTIIVIRIGEGVLSDLDNITVTYDGVEIDEIIDIEEFFILEYGSNPGWLRLLTTTGLYVLARIPHFSDHTITISSVGESVAEVVEAIGGITAVILYITIFAIVAIIYIVPILFVEKKK